MKITVTFDEVEALLTQAIFTRLGGREFTVTEIEWSTYNRTVVLELEEPVAKLAIEPGFKELTDYCEPLVDKPVESE